VARKPEVLLGSARSGTTKNTLLGDPPEIAFHTARVKNSPATPPLMRQVYPRNQKPRTPAAGQHDRSVPERASPFWSDDLLSTQAG
jgi:hypothetical protein